jgi:hypothetical protein
MKDVLIKFWVWLSGKKRSISLTLNLTLAYFAQQGCLSDEAFNYIAGLLVIWGLGAVGHAVKKSKSDNSTN